MTAAASVSPRCQHCHTHAVNRPRGLCWTCYYDPDISPLYPPDPTRHGNARGWRPDFNGTPQPPEPTHTQPGSEEKIEVLAERARLGLALHHPLDYRPQ